MPQAAKTAGRAAESKFRKRGDEQKIETAGMMRWLLTYADMITLMLALFIILFSMSTISRVKVQNFARSVSGGFDNVWSVNQPPNGGLNGAKAAGGTANVPAVEKQFQRYIIKNKLQSRVQVHIDHRGLVITLLSDKSYYNSGSARLRPQTKVILNEVSKFLRKNNNLVRVEGNTDNVPIRTVKYPSNWDLSTARAVNVVKYLVKDDGINPVRLSAAGYGKYHPRVPNTTAANRQENRRVDIVLLNADASRAERT
ncbi:MAG: OmpA/MotB family protein [Vulcanimicrobiaceae bacterium]